MKKSDFYYDLPEELIADVYKRQVYGTANARDLRAMSKTFQCLPGLKKSLSAGYSAMLTEIRESIDGMEDMYDLIERAI